jgi:hypothetical protein
MMIAFVGRKLQRPGVEPGFESSRPRLVRGFEPEQRDVGVGRVVDHVAIA